MSNTIRHYSAMLQASMNMILLTLILIINSLNACPEFLTKLCKCNDTASTSMHDHQGIDGSSSGNTGINVRDGTTAGGIILNCSNMKNVEDIIELLKRNQNQIGILEELQLRNASLTELKENLFDNLFIKKLDLSYNSISSIHKNAFNSNTNIIEKLYLNNNNLSSIDLTIFSPLTSLKLLDLSHNDIMDFLNLTITNSFPSLTKLNNINLSNNKICNLYKNVFENIKNNLQILNIGNNCLAEVPSSAIRGLRSLISLHLHGNPIKELKKLSFMNLPSLNLINLSKNSIAIMNKRAFFNVPQLKYLYLSDNNITEIQSNQFTLYDQLELIDLSYNNIHLLHNNSFSDIKSLRQLYLGFNSISSFDKNVFDNNNIIILILNNNNLKYLNNNMFNNLLKVQQLGLKNNLIDTIEKNTFYNNNELAMIDLSNNKIKEIKSETFLIQMNLILIDLSYNQLVKTPYLAFNRRIRTVILKENPLVCTEHIHILQQSVGIYIPNNIDYICRNNNTANDATEDKGAEFITDSSNQITTSTVAHLRSLIAERNNKLVIRPLANIEERSTTTMPVAATISELFNAISLYAGNDDDHEKQILSETLPPNIILANNFNYTTINNNNNINDVKYDKIKLNSTKMAETQDKNNANSTNNLRRYIKSKAPTIIAILCISIVLIIMLLVFIYLCIIKHKQLSEYNYGCYDYTLSSTSINHNHNYLKTSPNTMDYHQNNHQQWLYTLPSTYST